MPTVIRMLTMRTTAITTTESLVRLMTWLSPAFPVGAFSYSHGLEMAIEAGLVKDLESAVDWVTSILLYGAGRSDALLLLEAHRAVRERLDAELVDRSAGAEPPSGNGHALAVGHPNGSTSRTTDGLLSADDAGWQRLDAVVELAEALRPTAELALETAAQGKAFLTTVTAAWPDPWWKEWAARLRFTQRIPSYPVAVGAAAARVGLAEGATLAAFLHAFVSNLISAVVRLVPLGQTDGQRALASLEPLVVEASGRYLNLTLDDLGSSVPMVDWCSATHETQYTRLFRS